MHHGKPHVITNICSANVEKRFADNITVVNLPTEVRGVRGRRCSRVGATYVHSGLPSRRAPMIRVDGRNQKGSGTCSVFVLFLTNQPCGRV